VIQDLCWKILCKCRKACMHSL